jgi:hypothetical protein
MASLYNTQVGGTYLVSSDGVSYTGPILLTTATVSGASVSVNIDAARGGFLLQNCPATPLVRVKCSGTTALGRY